MPSYGSDADLIAYLAETGRALPVDAVPAEVRAMGSLYVDSFEDRFCGASLQDTSSFPRDIYNPTPVRIEWAAYEAGYAWSNGENIFGSGGSQAGTVKREKVDTLEVEYFGATDAGYWENSRYIVPMAYAHLLPYLCDPVGDEGKCMPGLGGGFVV